MSEFDCLVVMPFGTNPGEKTISRMTFDAVIVPALKKANVTGRRIDDIRLLDVPISDALLKSLRSVPVLIADVTGSNPNVLLELGYRRATGKPYILISRDGEEAVWWLNHSQVIRYGPEYGHAIDQIAEAVRRAIAQEETGGSDLKDQLMLSANELNWGTDIENPFVSQLAAWRFRRAEDDAKEMRAGRSLFAAKSFPEYVGYCFTAILGGMRSGQSYYTVTRPSFWSHEGVRLSGFLEENVEACRARGVAVYRVFMLEEAEFERLREGRGQGEAYHVLERHFRRFCSDPALKERAFIKVLPYSSVTELDMYGHFGLLSNAPDIDGVPDAHAAVVTPISQDEGLLKGLNIEFTKGTYRRSSIHNALQKFTAAFLHENSVWLEHLFS